MEKLNAYRKSYFGELSIGIWESQEYRVNAFVDDGVVRLDIERLDGRDGITWDELQKLKSECGYGEYDAVEFYPADRDVINTGNWRHLYVFDAPLKLIRRKLNG